MGIWLLSSILLVGICVFFLWKFRQKEEQYMQVIRSHEVQLQEKDFELQEREVAHKTLIEELKEEKASIEAKYLKKLKASEAKKKNLSRYRRKKKELRKKAVAEEAEEIIGKGASWLPHSCEGPKSSNLGKLKGSCGGDRKCSEKIHEERELRVHKYSHCGTNLDGVEEHEAYDRW